jgi:hypothetical protein
MSKTLVWLSTGDSIASTGGLDFARVWPYQYLGLTPTYPSDDVFGGGAVEHQSFRTYKSGNVIFKNMSITGSGYTNSTYMSFYELLKNGYIDSIVANKAIRIIGSPAPSERIYLLTCELGSNEGAKFMGDPDPPNNPTWPVTSTVPDYIAAVVQTMAARKTAGWDLIGLQTLLPRSDTSFLNETDRATYNSTITATGWAAANGIDFIIDVASDSIMGNPANLPANNGGDTTWYLDNAHPTTAGQARLVPYGAVHLDPIIAAL